MTMLGGEGVALLGVVDEYGAEVGHGRSMAEVWMTCLVHMSILGVRVVDAQRSIRQQFARGFSKKRKRWIS